MTMLIAPEALIDGVVRTLTEAVLPALPSRVARAQLYAAVDVLRNLRDRIEERAALLEEEADSAAAALAAAAAALGAGGAQAVAERLAETLARVPAAPAAARVAALRAALVAALEAIPPEAQGARRAIEGHLGAQALRDITTLKPSLLGEISKG
jgi:hypothetical protein